METIRAIVKGQDITVVSHLGTVSLCPCRVPRYVIRGVTGLEFVQSGTATLNSKLFLVHMGQSGRGYSRGLQWSNSGEFAVCEPVSSNLCVNLSFNRGQL